MAEAVGYVLNQWKPLTAFLSDGAVPIHNNLAEQQMKRIALGRKNYLFVGNERGGRTAAILSSITSTCRRHAIDPQVYLTQLLTNLPATPMSQLDQWLPDVWKQTTTRRRDCRRSCHAAVARPAQVTRRRRGRRDGVGKADTRIERYSSESPCS